MSTKKLPLLIIIVLIMMMCVGAFSFAVDGDKKAVLKIDGISDYKVIELQFGAMKVPGSAPKSSVVTIKVTSHKSNECDLLQWALTANGKKDAVIHVTGPYGDIKDIKFVDAECVYYEEVNQGSAQYEVISLICGDIVNSKYSLKNNKFE